MNQKNIMINIGVDYLKRKKNGGTKDDAKLMQNWIYPTAHDCVHVAIYLDFLVLSRRFTIPISLF